MLNTNFKIYFRANVIGDNIASVSNLLLKFATLAESYLINWAYKPHESL